MTTQMYTPQPVSVCVGNHQEEVVTMKKLKEDDLKKKLIERNKQLLEEVSWLKHDLARIKKSIRRVLGGGR